MALPTTLTNFAWPSDGIGWVGPFISSAGNVYVVSLYNASTTDVRIHKATDPTVSFSPQTDWTVVTNVTMGSISAHQVGDILHVFASGRDTTFNSHIGYRAFNMATDSWGTAVTTQIVAGNVVANSGIGGAKRSNGDVIVFYNAPYVVNMGKNYGRVAARRISGGTTVGAQTQIGFAPAATTVQTESVDSAVFATSDRVHLIWTRNNATAGSASSIVGRCVKSTDNLDGTAPATAEYLIRNATAFPNATVEGPYHNSGQAFCSSGGVLSVPYDIAASFFAAMMTATDADTPTWSNVSVSSASIFLGLVGATNQPRIGGSPFDGTDKYIVWIDNASKDPMYDKDVGSGYGTDTAIEATTANQISANIFQRGTSIVLAVVYDQSSTWVYNEVVIRTAGLGGPITPVTLTLTPVALTVVGSGNASRSLTNVNFTLTPVALVAAGSGTVTTSISPVTITLTPVALTVAAPAQNTSISPVTITLTPVALTQSVGTAAYTLTPVNLILTPIALVRSVGDVNRTLTPVTLTLTPVALTATGAPSTTSISPVIFTLTAVALTRGTDTVSTTLTPAILTLTAVALAKTVGDANRTITPVTLTLTPVALVRSVGNISTSITPATFTLTAVALVRSVGTSSVSISPAVLTLSSVALTYSVGTISTSISPVSMTLVAMPITGFTTTPGEGNILPAIFTLTPVALIRDVGGVSTSITSVTMTLTPVALTRGVDTIARTLTPVTLTFTAVALTRGTDTVARSITPAQFTLTAVALTSSVGTSSRSITPVTLTLTAVALTYTGGTISRTLTPVTMTLTAVSLTTSVGAVTTSINPAILSLIAVALTQSGVGGRPYVWNGIEWVEKPVKYWTGTVWIEKPMKVWTGSSWELV